MGFNYEKEEPDLDEARRRFGQFPDEVLAAFIKAFEPNVTRLKEVADCAAAAHREAIADLELMQLALKIR